MFLLRFYSLTSSTVGLRDVRALAGFGVVPGTSACELVVAVVALTTVDGGAAGTAAFFFPFDFLVYPHHQHASPTLKPLINVPCATPKPA
jgi:hypothetical protein